MYWDLIAPCMHRTSATWNSKQRSTGQGNAFRYRAVRRAAEHARRIWYPCARRKSTDALILSRSTKHDQVPYRAEHFTERTNKHCRALPSTTEQCRSLYRALASTCEHICEHLWALASRVANTCAHIHEHLRALCRAFAIIVQRICEHLTSP